MIRSQIRRARRHYRCSCGTHILPGDQYRESVISPDHGDIGNKGWWRAAECRACCVRYDRWPIENGGVDAR